MNPMLDTILTALRSGYLDPVYQQKQYLNALAIELYQKKELNKEDIEDLKDIISICNITYNDTDKEILPIEDGVYDLLLEKYKLYNPNFQVGAEVIDFKPSTDNSISNNQLDMVPVFTEIPYEDQDTITNGFYTDSIYIDETEYIDYRDFNAYGSSPINTDYVTKRTHDTEHNHPELVGTLDKCKFVLTKDAEEVGCLYDTNVKILERDFFADHIKKGIIRPDEKFEMVLELKYDGISVEADCTDEIVSARSRGDTGIGKASDLTPILKGYKFPHRPKESKMIGVKFEAIITAYDLPYFNKAKNYEYKNCRSAIVGLLSSSDAYKYRDFITLVPLAVERSVYENECECNRYKEIKFLNTYFVSKGCPLRYSGSDGTYIENLFLINRFLKEAEFARSYLPFMYDGIVVSYLDENKRRLLGRENFINKYSMAIKFNPLSKQTIFRGYTYTVGQDGTITPMIHYDPVEFYGTIHPKSSGHSFARFQELQLHIGDMIDVTYVNDVMPYVNKPLNDYNKTVDNITQAEVFPQFCPICNTPIIISDSGKSAKCPNPNCGGRSLARMVNTCAKLNMNGFGEATIRDLNVYHLKDLVELFIRDDYIDIVSSYGFGPGEIANMKSEINNLLSRPIVESELLGAVGFDNVSTKTWELILSKLQYNQFDILYNTYTKQGSDELKNIMVQIKGIGPATVETILSEYEYFRSDIQAMIAYGNIIQYVPIVGKKIRATGFRDKALFDRLRSMGLDADDNGSVTKDTDILLVPNEGHISSKTQKAQQYGVQIIPVQDFINNMDNYI